MFGAMEVKSVSRFVREHASEWRPIHSALVGCLLAHRNNRSQRCCPSRASLAKHVNVSERTVDRAMAQLRAWGAIEMTQPRLLSGQMGPRQYTLALAFEPPPQDIAVSLPPRDISPQDRAVSAPRDKAVSATGRQKPGDKAVTAEAKAFEFEAEFEAKGGSRGHPPKPNRASQSDFDERDLRKLTAELATLYRQLEGARIVDSQHEREREGAAHSHEEIFYRACARAGIPVARGLELTHVDWKKKNPGKHPLDDAKARTGSE